MSAILLTSAQRYDFIRLVGAAYLVWIGGRMLWSAIRETGTAAGALHDTAAADVDALRTGLAGALGQRWWSGPKLRPETDRPESWFRYDTRLWSR